MRKRLGSEKGSALIITSVLIMIVGIFALNLNRQSEQTAKMQKTENIARDRNHVERFIRIVLSNEDLCTSLVKVDNNNQVRIDKFEFQSGSVRAHRFQFQNVRYILGNLKLGDFTYDTECPGRKLQGAHCVRAGSIPILYSHDLDGNLTKCQFGGGEKHCNTMGGVWVESAKECDLCLGLGGLWENGRCAFR